MPSRPPAGSRRRATARSRCGHWWSGSRRRRRRVPRALGAGRGGAHAPVRRRRPGRGIGAGGIRPRCRAVAGRWSAGIPFRRPPRHLLAERLDHAAAVIYLVFNEGYSASSGGDVVRRDLCDESIRLTRLLVSQLPAEPEPRGLLALMLLHHARAAG